MSLLIYGFNGILDEKSMSMRSKASRPCENQECATARILTGTPDALYILRGKVFYLSCSALGFLLPQE
ncbi:hypothetical protein WG906_17210 [Pedobacter sp. P351]|uniref:hypothetical protein n=1 Tax=Pedobacter superstes TaxID=3133441 RepID=UPI0030B2D45A